MNFFGFFGFGKFFGFFWIFLDFFIFLGFFGFGEFFGFFGFSGDLGDFLGDCTRIFLSEQPLVQEVIEYDSSDILKMKIVLWRQPVKSRTFSRSDADSLK